MRLQVIKEGAESVDGLSLVERGFERWRPALQPEVRTLALIALAVVFGRRPRDGRSVAGPEGGRGARQIAADRCLGVGKPKSEAVKEGPLSGTSISW